MILIACIFLLPKAVKYFTFNKSIGKVTQISTGKFISLKGNDASFQYPVILYTTQKWGDLYYRKNNEILFGMPEVGDKIMVIYNPDNKEETFLNRLGSFWFTLPDLLLFGILCILLIGIVNIIYVKPRKKSNPTV